jgi:hypothetical protein
MTIPCSLVLSATTWQTFSFFLSFFLSIYLSFFLSFFLSFLVWPLLHTHCTCRGLLLHLITLNDTHAHTVRLLWTRDQPTQRPLPNNTQHSQETNIHAPVRIRIRNPSKRATADLRLRPRGHWDRLTPFHALLYATKVYIIVSKQALKESVCVCFFLYVCVCVCVCVRACWNRKLRNVQRQHIRGFWDRYKEWDGDTDLEVKISACSWKKRT